MGRIVDLVHLGAVPGLCYQLHGRLEEIQVESDSRVKPVQTLISCLGSIPVVTDQAAHHVAVFLLHMAAIILLVGARPGKDNVFLVAIGIETLVDEFTAVIRVYPEQVKGRRCRMRWTAVFTLSCPFPQSGRYSDQPLSTSTAESVFR